MHWNPLDTPQSTLAFTFDGQPLGAVPGETIAAALLRAGITAFRATPVRGRPRGPFCMMGTCNDCLVSVGGVVVRACATPVTEGLAVERVRRDD